jgi:hypothetical protein
MRDRSLLPSKHRCREAYFPSLHSDHEPIRPEMIRNFNPGDVDLDELAEAIRQFLSPGGARTGQPHRRRDPDLLSSRRGATHVVGSDAP